MTEITDPTFYRTPADAIAAAPESLACSRRLSTASSAAMCVAPLSRARFSDTRLVRGPNGMHQPAGIVERPRAVGCGVVRLGPGHDLDRTGQGRPGVSADGSAASGLHRTHPS